MRVTLFGWVFVLAVYRRRKMEVKPDAAAWAGVEMGDAKWAVNRPATTMQKIFLSKLNIDASDMQCAEAAKLIEQEVQS